MFIWYVILAHPDEWKVGEGELEWLRWIWWYIIALLLLKLNLCGDHNPSWKFEDPWYGIDATIWMKLKNSTETEVIIGVILGGLSK